MATIRREERYPQRALVNITNGIALVASDIHIWPDVPCAGLRALAWGIRQFRPKLVCLNGDVIDGAALSRHPHIGWEKIPEPWEEIKETQARLTPIEKACDLVGAVRTWNLGNHDMRFEVSIANKLPAFARIPGVHLRDHFPEWAPAWSTWINPEVDVPTVIKHRAPGNLETATKNAGTHLVLGHDHNGRVVRVSQYTRELFGVNAGMLAPKYGPQFTNYTEDRVQNWTTTFAVLTYIDCELQWPELVWVTDEARGEISFRGELFYV